MFFLAVQSKLRHQELHRLEVERRRAMSDGSQPVMAPLLAKSEAISSAILQQQSSSTCEPATETISSELGDQLFFEKERKATVLLPTSQATGRPTRNMTVTARCDEGRKAEYVFPWRMKERKRPRDDSSNSSKEPLSVEAMEYKKRCR